MAHKHKFKVGDRVISEGVISTIHTIGYATANSRNFTVCAAGTEVADADQIGYQVFMGHKIKIMKECDITLA